MRKRSRYAYHADVTLDDTFFSTIDTEEKAYILGFIAADGCVLAQYNRLTIVLHPRDRDILERIRACLHSQNILREYAGKWPSVKWTTTSERLIHDLGHYGIVSKKSLTLAYPDLPKPLERHYIRGLWDGDGHISRHDIVLKGSQETTANVQRVIHDATGCLLRITPQNNIFALRGSGRDAPAVRWLYEHATIAMARKLNAYEAFWKDGTVIRHSLKPARPRQLRFFF